MSIYSFQENAPTVTTTTTTILGSTDVLIVYSNNLGRTSQATIGSISSLGSVTTVTSASTATYV